MLGVLKEIGFGEDTYKLLIPKRNNKVNTNGTESLSVNLCRQSIRGLTFHVIY